MTDLIKNLNWRYATKEFDTSKKISEENLNEIIESFRLSPSSFGLEPWKLVIVENKEIREKLKGHSWNQAQIVDASHLLVFTRIKDYNNSNVDNSLDNMCEKTGASREDLKGYEGMMTGYFSSLDETATKKWEDDQVFLSLGFVMNSLAQMNIDSCAIGGFDPAKYDEILKLSDKNLESVVVLPIGYRKDSDKYSSKSKVRFDTEKIVEFIK